MHWPADIGEQMAAVHRIYPIVETAADPKLVELLKFVEASENCRLTANGWHDLARRAHLRQDGVLVVM